MVRQLKCLSQRRVRTASNSVYKQLLFVPVRTSEKLFSIEKNGPGHFIKVIVSGKRSGTENATAHTRGRWTQLVHYQLLSIVYFRLTGQIE